eukprot:jgi/Antlo1/1994/2203
MIPDKIPCLSLPAYYDGEIQEMSLESLLESDYLVLVFYPYDFTTVCPSEINEFSKRRREFIEAGASIAFVSCDSVHSHRTWAQMKSEEGGVRDAKWPMLSDYEKKLSQTLFLLNKDGSCKRATVIVDKKMEIRHYSFNDNSIGRSVFEVIRLVNALSFSDKHGSMCLVNWERSPTPAK